ncbi:MAG: hypothetical protein P8J87_18570 [Verrucomicrobiales bacterium]|nr:hypothetical protein [Verrucomicrobiales bacterium]
MQKQDISFTELEPMADPGIRARLEAALIEQKFKFDGLPLVFHLPIVEVNGKLLAKPSINEIWEALSYNDRWGVSSERSARGWSKSKAGTGVLSRRITPLDETVASE